VPFRALFTPAFRLRPGEERAGAFRRAGAAPDQADEVIAYCRLGHRASLLWFAATRVLGWEHVRVYDGSWTEWGSTVGSPIER
jgi:thiosulfate/3-mercaptopyruvate sulfurtransferase